MSAVPGLARIAFSAWRHTAQWTLETSVRTSARVVGAALAGESPAELFRDLGEDARRGLRELLAEPAGAAPPAVPPAVPAPTANGAGPSLQDRGAELLQRSADVDLEEDVHPAYARILDELAPDEARILRLLAHAGPQPSVDVRSGGTIHLGSELLAPGLTMIGAEAGCRHLERVPAHLNNLERLGLVWFSREPVADPLRYQVLEAQPDVLDARRRGGRAHTVRRSIHLTPFGADFCAVCLPAAPLS